MKHISGQENKVVNALSRRSLIMQESQVKILGFDYLKDLYTNFQEAFEACKNLVDRDRIP